MKVPSCLEGYFVTLNFYLMYSQIAKVLYKYVLVGYIGVIPTKDRVESRINFPSTVFFSSNRLRLYLTLAMSY